MSEDAKVEFSILETKMEVRIEAPVDKVWKALTDDIGAWWPKSFCVGEATDFILEPRVGGRMYQDAGDGQGMLWATVTAIRAKELIETAGDLGADYGGPARTLSRYQLTPDGEATVLRFTDSVFGKLTESYKKHIEAGWSLLFETCLRSYLEQGKLAEPAARS